MLNSEHALHIFLSSNLSVDLFGQCIMQKLIDRRGIRIVCLCVFKTFFSFEQFEVLEFRVYW